MIATALIAKFLSAGAMAQAAAGAGVVVVVTAGAGTIGVLPGDAQTAFSDVTGIEAPAEDPGTTEGTPPVDEELGDPAVLPEEEVVGEPVVEEPVVEEPVAEPTDAEAAAAWAEDGKLVTSQAEFKAWLALGNENGWVTGQAVSAAAHARNEARRAPDVEETPEAPEEEVADETDAVESSDDDRPGKGGNGNSSGKGNGGGKGKGRG